MQACFILSFLCPTTVCGQFRSIKELQTSGDKLDDYFLQARDFWECRAMICYERKVRVDPADDTNENVPRKGLTITVRSTKHRLSYYFNDYDRIGTNGTASCFETLIVGAREKRHFSNGPNRLEGLPERIRKMIPSRITVVEPDPTTGLRAQEGPNDSFYLEAVELDPYGLVLGDYNSIIGRGSNVDRMLRRWEVRTVFDSETESIDVTTARWKSTGSASTVVREIVFDNRVGGLPTNCRYMLLDKAGKINGSYHSEVKTSWDEYEPGRWKPVKITFSGKQGKILHEQSYDLYWVEANQVDELLSKYDWKKLIEDDSVVWHKLFRPLFESSIDVHRK
jgi:hypothetical protein